MIAKGMAPIADSGSVGCEEDGGMQPWIVDGIESKRFVEEHFLTIILGGKPTIIRWLPCRYRGRWGILIAQQKGAYDQAKTSTDLQHTTPALLFVR
jgi:hypothetical protein